MAPRTVIAHYEDFAGLDLKTSDLTGDPAKYKELQNFHFSKQRSIRGRKGCQVVGQPGAFTSIHTYSYWDVTTGETKQELIAANDQLWRLYTNSFEVYGPLNWNWKMSLDPATQTFKFSLNVAGSQVFVVDVGTGLEDAATVYTVADLVAAIDALTDFSAIIYLWKDAVVDGDQNDVNTITVNAGWTDGFYPFGPLWWFWDYETEKLVWRRASSTTATTLAFVTAGFQPVTVKNGQHIGIGAIPAASIWVNDAYTSTFTTQVISFQYWAPVPHDQTPNKPPPFTRSWNNRNVPTWKPHSYVNAQNNCYIGYYHVGCNADRTGPDGGFYKYDGQRCYRAGLPMPYAVLGGPIPAGGASRYHWLLTWQHTDNRGNIWEGPAYYMGTTGDTATAPPNQPWRVKQLTDTVMPESNAIGVINGSQSGVGTQTGLTLNSGHGFVVGDTVHFLNHTTSALAVRVLSATAATTISWATNEPVSVLTVEKVGIEQAPRYPPWGVNVAYAIVSGAQTGVTGGCNVLAGHTLLPGDKITLLDAITASDLATRGVVTRTITSVSPTFVGWQTADPITVANGQAISVGLTWRLYRTADHGIVYYLAYSQPNNPTVEWTTLTDAMADAYLGPAYDEPAVGYEHDITPAANYLTLHQGLMVGAGDSNAPNTVYFSDPAGLEYFPIASNSVDIPSNVAGAITGIASDTEDRLAVFKPDAYYDVPGDLASGAFSVKAIREGDYGITAHASICKVNGFMVGIGKLGFVSVRGGELFDAIGHDTNPAIQGNRNLNLGQSTALLDPTRMQYRCYIPGILNSQFAEMYERMFCFDFETESDLFFSWKYASGSAPSGGMALLAENISYVPLPASLLTLNTDKVFVPYHLNREASANPGHAYRELTTQTAVQNYADNHQAIQYIIRSTPQHLGLPKRDKAWLRLVLWSFYSSYEQMDFTPWTARIRSYRNFQEAVPHTDLMLDFTAAQEFEKNINLFDGQARALQFYLEVNAIGECPHLTGWELWLTMPYDEEDIRK